MRGGRPTGSSPLARGLPSCDHPGCDAFMDHPRSRGVYTKASPEGGWRTGSSPLARGLLADAIPGASGKRIIPARAGFTPRPGHHVPAQRDHPRSRGVYSTGARTTPSETGSSPLARGLQLGQLGQKLGQGIIPARAGFTSTIMAAKASLSDHPRSRGVYSCLLHRASRLAGSSPLARGLLPLLVVEDLPLGIIPARAGFTAFRRVFRRRCRDHPRSRGVYRTSKGRSISMSGSSPLARGLPVQDQRRGGQWRIIPARAGFTADRHPGRHPNRDHPRSRGVYHELLPTEGHAAGSSPLARGLPVQDQRRGGQWRIIPARAGFTWARPATPFGSPDHPRSRGVYEQVLDVRRRQVRIIPARAGFTPWWSAPGGPGPDHPRSRGVYSATSPRTWITTGSSPLARGLPR